MLIFYLACLLFGGILLGVSLLSGGGDIDGTDALDSGHADLHSLDTHSDFDLTADASVDHIDMSHSEISKDIIHPTDAVKFLSFRNVIYFSTFYGLTGTILTLMAMPFIVTLASALGIGTLSWAAGHKLMSYLKDSESGEALNSSNFIGRSGKVTIPAKKDKIGKIIVKSNNEIHELMVKVSDTSESDSYDRGEEVFIIDYSNGIYFIVSQQQI